MSKEFDIPDPKGSELKDLHNTVLKLLKKYRNSPRCTEILAEALVEIAREEQM